MKQTTILTAQTLGYFRAKNDEKRELILGELLELEEFENISRETVTGILEAETLRRHVVYQNRAKKAFNKIEAEAAKPLTGGVDNATSHIQKMPPGVYILSGAQNNTDVDPQFLAAIENYAARKDATIMLGKITYNLHGFQQGIETEGIYYDPAIVKYLVNGTLDFGNIQFAADANILPTAHHPLSGFQSLSPSSLIVPASKISLQCLPNLKNGKQRMMLSSGLVTKRNYVARKAGNVALGLHNIGAVILEVADDLSFEIRHIERMPDSAGFHDENVFYGPDYTIEGQYPEVLQLGDIHAEKMTQENKDKCLKLIEWYRPEHLMLHDVLDFSNRSHHNIKDGKFLFSEYVAGNSVMQDLQTVTNVIEEFQASLWTAAANKEVYYTAIHIIESNHDLALEKWVLTCDDIRKDPINAIVYLKCMLALYEAVDNKDTRFNLLEFAYSGICGGDTEDIYFHKADESLVYAGVEHGCHGHTGINGARGGGSKGFAALGVKMNTGHTHTPSITHGVYTAGVSGALEMGYNVGPSSWRLAHIVTYPNGGQRQIIFM